MVERVRDPFCRRPLTPRVAAHIDRTSNAKERPMGRSVVIARQRRGKRFPYFLPKPMRAAPSV